MSNESIIRDLLNYHYHLRFTDDVENPAPMLERIGAWRSLNKILSEICNEPHQCYQCIHFAPAEKDDLDDICLVKTEHAIDRWWNATDCKLFKMWGEK